MEVKELGHVVLFVADVERSRHFYTDVLGFRELNREGRRPNTATYSTGRTHHELYLMQVGEDAQTHPGGEAPGPLPHRHQDRHDGRGVAGRARRAAGGRGARRRPQRPRSHPQPLHPRPGRQRDRAVHRRAAGDLARGVRAGGPAPARPARRVSQCTVLAARCACHVERSRGRSREHLSGRRSAVQRSVHAREIPRPRCAPLGMTTRAARFLPPQERRSSPCCFILYIPSVDVRMSPPHSVCPAA